MVSDDTSNLLAMDGHIVDTIADLLLGKLTSMRSWRGNSTPSIPAEIVLEMIRSTYDCTEQTFIQWMNCLKAQYPSIHKHVDMPKKWNVLSHLNYPEAYPAPDRVLCLVKQPFHSAQIYANTGERIWQPNEKVWVPSDHPTVIQAMCDDILIMIGTYNPEESKTT